MYFKLTEKDLKVMLSNLANTFESIYSFLATKYHDLPKDDESAKELKMVLDVLYKLCPIESKENLILLERVIINAMHIKDYQLNNNCH